MGIAYTFDLNRPLGKRVTRLEFQGRPVQPEERFSLCMCDYRATGSGDFDMYEGCPRLRDIQTEISELMLRYLETHDPVSTTEVHPLRVLA